MIKKRCEMFLSNWDWSWSGLSVNAVRRMLPSFNLFKVIQVIKFATSEFTSCRQKSSLWDWISNGLEGFCDWNFLNVDLLAYEPVELNLKSLYRDVNMFAGLFHRSFSSSLISSLASITLFLKTSHDICYTRFIFHHDRIAQDC